MVDSLAGHEMSVLERYSLAHQPTVLVPLEDFGGFHYWDWCCLVRKASLETAIT